MAGPDLAIHRNKGLFAGIDLNGDEIHQNAKDTRELYGSVVPFRAVLLGKVPPPQTTSHFLSVVKKWASPGVQAKASQGCSAAEVVTCVAESASGQ